MTLSAEASPASQSQSRAKVSRKTTRAGSGPSSPELLAYYSPLTSSWKTYQHSPLGAYPLLLERLPRSGMTRNGKLYRLHRSVPRTLESDSSLLPTPTASRYGTNQGGAAGRSGKVRYSLDAMARHDKWPTPQARDWKDAHAGSSVAQPHGNHSPSLPRAVAMEAMGLWPTPTASDGTGGPGSSGRQGGKNLRTAVQHRPTTGPLNPTWVEWLMGFPLGWTDLNP